MTKRATSWRARIAVAALFGAVIAVAPGVTQAEPVHVAEFVADCPLSHRLPDDPIVLPGLAGASHSHDFMGNHSTNAASTYQTLLTASGNCNPLSTSRRTGCRPCTATTSRWHRARRRSTTSARG